jgi:DNA invertase Pin-like site-specific DNA recombinase
MSIFGSPLPPPGSRAILLARYSDSHQNPLSADDQLAVLREDCARYGWIVAGEFKDEAKSGRYVGKRTGYIEAMAMAEAGLADVICVFDLDRLGRNSRELRNAKDRLADVNAVIYTHTKGVMNRLEFAIYAEMAQIESEKIAERTSRGRRAAAARGRIMGDIPYGYRAVPEMDANGKPLLNSRGQQIRDVEIDPVTSKVVLRVNLDFDAGMGPHQIAVALTNEGIPTPEGGKVWHPNTILGVARSMSGLLRNPMLIGKVIHGKVINEYDERTGRHKKRKADVAHMIEFDAPWLRIVPQEVWDRNQERLSGRQPSKLRDRRRPTYLLTGLSKCGVCGGPFVQVATKMGCAHYRLKACTNSRRVKREDLERVVLEGLTQRLAQSHIMTWFIPEYVRERGSANTEQEDRHQLALQRLAEVEREIENMIAQVKAGARGFAAQLINEDLERSGAEKERLARVVRAGPQSAAAVPLTPENLVGRMQELLANLGEWLQGDERDATRARDIIRRLITKITLTPLEDRGGRPDGRSTGTVRVVIEGEVSNLVDAAMLDRKIMHGQGASDMHDLSVATFKFYVDLDRSLSPEQEGLWRDAAIIARMLDDADWPIQFQEMVEAMNDRGRETTTLERETDETRARIALAQFRREDWVRSIHIGGQTRGWIWSERNLSDDEWRERFRRHTEEPAPPEEGVRASGQIGVIRMSGPEAHVVVVGERRKKE